MLKLLYAPTSPYVRKVMVCAHLAGVADQIQWLDSAANPVRRDDRIAVYNPLAKVPTLILADGQALYDSRVICEYLAHLGGNADLFPAAGPRRWVALAQQALGDGLLDAALLARYERTARPAEYQWSVWREAQLVKVDACLVEIERQIEPPTATLPTQAPTIGDVTLGCALGYLDFRFPELDWRASHPRATQWEAAFRKLPAMQATLPHEA
ncbi:MULTISPECIES: glutathione S-transferase [Achromobacter]|uniref:Glutathione S-transferase n=1 Tax=Achromobacter spanius TaxID=217203 RepID=A0ABY8GMM8_9BURK|nr:MULTISPECIES: glutathione S-transferase [Achromobacter]WAI84853.1 glutathione S-transferase [Achromobacter spanius]WEX94936.1 glutathione S-transferase [Achromobacter sp. SS2-2022]WFP05896.1 glutathione S-transferase [Achromobacter spanius]